VDVTLGIEDAPTGSLCRSCGLAATLSLRGHADDTGEPLDVLLFCERCFSEAMKDQRPVFTANYDEMEHWRA